jgi:hypothetical protein
MNARCSRLPLPSEILEKIAFYVDSHDDLISLALTSRKLKEVVIPSHSDYRMIAVQHDNHDLWDHLRKVPRDAQHVKVLHLYDPHDWTPPRRYPKAIDDRRRDDDESIQLSKEKEEIKLKNMLQA